MKTTWSSIGKAIGLSLAALACAQPAYADEAKLNSSATSFFTETQTFGTESNLLRKNTQEVDNALLDFENALAVPHKLATALRKLDDTLAVLKQALVVAKQVPQTKAQATKLEGRVDAIKPRVAAAATEAEKVDKAVEPVRNATAKAEDAAAAALDYEGKFQTVAFGYIGLLERCVECARAKPAIETQTITIVDGSTKTFHGIDETMKQVNQTYAQVVNAPVKALDATINQLGDQLDKLEEMLKSVGKLQAQLDPLDKALADVKAVLDQSVGFSFDYPCGTKMCSQNTPYPCGTKMCSGKITDYPCTKWCDHEVPFPCGVKTCDATVKMSISTVVNGADQIERKIESLLSSTAWEALKVIGVKKYVDDLQNKANGVLDPVLRKLNLDLALDLPNLDVKVDNGLLTGAVPKFAQLEQGLLQFSKTLDMSTTPFAPHVKSLQSWETEIKKATTVCQAPPPPPKAKPVPPRIVWRHVSGFGKLPMPERR